VVIGHSLALWRVVRLQGLIFDIDGTLVDTNDLHAQCWQEAFAKFGKNIEYPVIRSQIGKGGDLLVPDLLNAKEMRKFGRKVKDYRSDLYKKEYMPKARAFPRIRELFEDLRRRKVKIALASSSNPDEVEFYTKLLRVGDLLEGSTSKEDARMSKPSPEIFEAALERIGTDDAYTFTVGDTPYDILASHRCALPIVAVLSGGFERPQLTKAEFLFDDVGELGRKIEQIDAYFDE
jgi:HAD superfamily hydrolase (TIGR01549 family)